MVKFRPYDKVRRIGKDWDEVENGKTYIVASIMNDWAISLGGLEGGYDSQHFEFVESPVAYDKDNAPLYVGDTVTRIATENTAEYEGTVAENQSIFLPSRDNSVRVMVPHSTLHSMPKVPLREYVELKARKEDLPKSLAWTDVEPGDKVIFMSSTGETLGPVTATGEDLRHTYVLGRKVINWIDYGKLISIEKPKDILPTTPDSKIRRDGIDYVLDALGGWHSLRDGRTYAKTYFANGYWTLVRDAAMVES